MIYMALLTMPSAPQSRALAGHQPLTAALVDVAILAVHGSLRLARDSLRSMMEGNNVGTMERSWEEAAGVGEMEEGEAEEEEEGESEWETASSNSGVSGGAGGGSGSGSGSNTSSMRELYRRRLGGSIPGACNTLDMYVEPWRQTIVAGGMARLEAMAAILEESLQVRPASSLCGNYPILMRALPSADCTGALAAKCPL